MAHRHQVYCVADADAAFGFLYTGTNTGPLQRTALLALNVALPPWVDRSAPRPVSLSVGKVYSMLNSTLPSAGAVRAGDVCAWTVDEGDEGDVFAPGILVEALPAARALFFQHCVCARTADDVAVLVLLPLTPADLVHMTHGDTHRPGSPLYARLQAVVDGLAVPSNAAGLRGDGTRVWKPMGTPVPDPAVPVPATAA